MNQHKLLLKPDYQLTFRQQLEYMDSVMSGLAQMWGLLSVCWMSQQRNHVLQAAPFPEFIQHKIELCCRWILVTHTVCERSSTMNPQPVLIGVALVKGPATSTMQLAAGHTFVHWGWCPLAKLQLPSHGNYIHTRRKKDPRERERGLVEPGVSVKWQLHRR